MKAAIYARVSTTDQTCENQLRELRAYCKARGLTATEFVDAGVSGAKESRPALDAMLREARRRKFDLLIVWKLDRLGRSLRHLILTLDDLHALCVGFVSLTEALDTTTPAGRFQMQILGAVAEFERGMIRERVVTGLARARAHAARTPPHDSTARGFAARAYCAAGGEAVGLFEIHSSRPAARGPTSPDRTNPRKRRANLGWNSGHRVVATVLGQSGVCPVARSPASTPSRASGELWQRALRSPSQETPRTLAVEMIDHVRRDVKVADLVVVGDPASVL
jgi:hypothetical protein